MPTKAAPTAWIARVHPGDRSAASMIARIREAQYRARADACTALSAERPETNRKGFDAGARIGTTMELRADRERFEELYAEQLERRRAVIAWEMRKWARTLVHRGLLVPPEVAGFLEGTP